MPKVEYIILTGLIVGTLARFYLLRIDFRQYPSYPQGYVIHLTLGTIAASLGAVVIPAILAKEYTAVTFLTVAIQQFREVRRMERDSLENVDRNELVKRGGAYIEDISKRFEARNYVSMIAAFLTTVAVYLTKSLWISGLIGILITLLLSFAMRSKKVRDIAEVRAGRIYFEGAFLMVDDVVIMNLVIPKFREIILKKGRAVIVTPNDLSGQISLANPGQRQAILHDVVSILGTKKEPDEPELSAVAKRNADTGALVFFFVNMETDTDKEIMVELVKKCPILETTKKQPLDSYTGKRLLKKQERRNNKR